MALRPVRTSQPQGPARVDWSNPITRGLREVWTANNACGVVTNTPITLGVGVTKAVRKQATWRFDGSATAFINTNVTSAQLGVSGNTEKTIIVVYSEPNYASLTSHIFGCGSGNVVGGDFVLKTIQFSRIASQLWGDDGSFVDRGGRDLSQYVSLLKYDKSRVSIYGADNKSNSAALTLNTSNTNFRIGNWSFSSANFNGDVYMAGVFARALSDAEIKSLSDNPWQIFAPDSKALWVPASVSVSLPTLVQPNSTTSAGAWTATGAASLHAAINEATPSAAEYISVNAASTTELVMAEAAYPGAANQTLAYRASSTQNSTLTVTLKQGVTTIMTRTHSLTGIDTLYTQTLTAPEIALITAGAISVTLTTS